MELEVTPAVEWKLDRAVEVMLGPDANDGDRDFNERVEVVVGAWESAVESGSGWTDRAADIDPGSDESLPGFEDRENRDVPEFDRDPVTRSVEPRVARRIEAVAAAESHGRQVGELSFNEALNLALEAWNEYGSALGVGWVDRSHSPFDYYNAGRN